MVLYIGATYAIGVIGAVDVVVEIGAIDIIGAVTHADTKRLNCYIINNSNILLFNLFLLSLV